MVQKLLLLKGPSPVTAHWVAYQWSLQQTWKWTFLQDGHKMPPNHGQIHSHEGALWLKTGTCYLSLWRLKHSNIPWKEFRWKSEIRHSVLLEKWTKLAFRQSDIFRKTIFLEPRFLHLLVPKKTLKLLQDLSVKVQVVTLSTTSNWVCSILINRATQVLTLSRPGSKLLPNVIWFLFLFGPLITIIILLIFCLCLFTF